MANILALDTATEACSVALSWQGQRYELYEEVPREHTKKILPMVEAILAEAGVSLAQLDAIAYGRGPGSFTGVRIGVAAAQGLAFGADLPLIGVSTLQAMAQRAIESQEASHVVAAIDARMGEIYHGIFRNEQNLAIIESNEQVLTCDKLAGSAELSGVAVGTGWQTYQQELMAKYPKVDETLNVALPHAFDMLPFAQSEFALGHTVSSENATPVYLRDKVTWKKLPGRE